MQTLPSEPTETSGTDVRRFLARRGAVVVRETRNIGGIPGLYTDSLVVSTLVLAVVKGQGREMSYGVKFERNEDDRTTASVFLDFDEISELVEAFDFIGASASDMAGKQRDYTEVTYSTKDNARFGFYQEKGKQQSFVELEPHSDLIFFQLSDFFRLKSLLVQAKSHLEQKGAGVV